jgi:hypothetical protein
MPNPLETRAAQLIAERLPTGLLHPGDPTANPPVQPRPIILPGMSHNGIPAEAAEHFAHEAGMPHSDVPKLFSEAIMATITTELDATLITNTELAQLRERATELDASTGTKALAVQLRCNTREPFLRVATNRAVVQVDCAQAKAQIAHVCTCEADA